MKHLEIFIKALQKRIGTDTGILVHKYAVIPTKVPVIKTYSVEVWIIKNSEKILIAEVKRNINVNENTEYDIQNSLLLEIIEKTLKYFGV